MLGSEGQHAPKNGRERHSSRQRAQLSCDRCRKYKKKCNRCSPCAECQFKGEVCTFQRAAVTSHALAESQQKRQTGRKRGPSTLLPLSPRPTLASARENSLSSSPNESVGPDGQKRRSASHQSPLSILHPSPLSNLTTVSDGSSTDSLNQLEAIISAPNTLKHIMAVWRGQDDWYHEIVDDSPFSMTMQRGRVDAVMIRRYAGLIYVILAIVAETNPSEVDAILIQLEASNTVPHSFESASQVGQTAKQAAKAWLTEETRESDAMKWPVDVSQTSFLLTKLNKFTGSWPEYRDALACDVVRIQRARLNFTAGVLANKMGESETICTRHRVFWHYFALERLSSLFDGVPYNLQARNCDMWLYEEGEATHIHTLCDGSLDSAVCRKHPPANLPIVLQSSLSPCAQLMIRLAALAGKSQDRIASINSSFDMSTQNRIQLAERIAAKTELELTQLQDRQHKSFLTPSQRFFITIATSRVRRGVVEQLNESLRMLPEEHHSWQTTLQLFSQRQINLSKALIQCAALNAGQISLRTMAEPFFTMFIHDPVIDLLTSVQKQSDGGSVRLDESILDNLRSALTGRNLLVVISRQSELPLNHRVAKDICQLLSKLLLTITSGSNDPDQEQVYISLSDPTRIVSPGILARLGTSHLNSSEVEPAHLQQAGDVLEWVASLPALQNIFQLSSPSCGPNCDGRCVGV